MDCLLLRLDAPLMSFGAVTVDQINPTWRFPARSMLVGLLGNALGWDHRDTGRLQALQARLRFAARWDAEPELLTEYQTVDLGQDFMMDTGWTTRGQREDRKGGTASTGTHPRRRDHWANGVATVAIALDGDGAPTLDALEAALRTPARPLFIGRKPCLPAAPLLIGRRQAAGVKAALEAEPLADIGPRRRPSPILALWPRGEGEGKTFEERYDLRDWTQNIHRGSERYAVGPLEVAR
ncbi:type I-E CRISPR-associated protein Cas5/CasD [Caldimonas thermodepolymerans]|jgi:CRISPR system Cascade subunit CasD|uniref:CRISPR-associated Cas5e family protein n=1 Tax=Caldimonas thermodepolymerans TaxID=215580 RepID=A0AA46HVW8_9BURK|nr:type I-E CRISPR-associated protein Cas5/CasD [Caldimonas thermodepolymerans]TCP07488.1 CRISPR-associated Cas5e family protein [Caldimonas thermodepolymerans]UZG43995.1 type I-E CRISPR-associated protein Cas5/CasD [Caldimonas thermodepolymerans]UZG47662.1 type I-E CRISPR-associated protein Cas5/CasD [Caldimonas thermodepolymerans]